MFNQYVFSDEYNSVICLETYQLSFNFTFLQLEKKVPTVWSQRWILSHMVSEGVFSVFALEAV